jgi:hypothetical protein
MEMNGMNQDQVKDALERIDGTTKDFTVIFSGKASKKVNGLYKPATNEILIHNRNFKDDNSLLYTAIHEYAHHIHYTKNNESLKMNNNHPNAFWAIFHDLLDRAEKLGLYKDVFGGEKELTTLTISLKSDIFELATILKRIGRRLIQAMAICKQINARYEDYIDRVLKISRGTAKLATSAVAMDVPEAVGIDGMKTICGIRDDDKRAMVTSELINGKSQEQGKAIARVKTTPDESHESRLKKELCRITNTIHRLESRKTVVEQELNEVSTESVFDLDIDVCA